MNRLLVMMTLLLTPLGSLAAESVEATPTVVDLAGIELTIPAGLHALAEPPAGALAAWRSADGVAALALVLRPAEDAAAAADQLATLQALGQDVEILASGEHPAGSGWQRFRYRLDLGPTRFEQDARLGLLRQPEGLRQVVVTASWPLDAAPRWDAALSAALDALAPIGD